VGTVTNGDRRFDELCEPEPAAQLVFDVVFGVIAELTQGGENAAGRPMTEFTSKGVVGRAQHSDFLSSLDIVEFEPSESDDDPLPKSFEGLSGGGLWRFFVNYEAGKPVLLRTHLIGVAFFETDRRQIVCHGPRSIYEVLRPKLCAA